MKNYSKNETVVARLSGESGVVIDDENDAQLGCTKSGFPMVQSHG